MTLPTSGTTGEPKRIHFSAADQELTVDFFHHGMSVLARSDDRVLILLPGERPGSVGELLARGLERLGATPLPYGPVGDVDAALDALEGERASVVVGIPVQVLALARRGAAQGRELRLRSVLLSTDHVPQAIVSAVERAWGCRVFNHYGATEMGLGGGVECAAHAGLHLREADLLFEVVDPLTGAPLPPGQEGEVVFTTLTREAMPLIRYRTGDLGSFVAERVPLRLPAAPAGQRAVAAQRRRGAGRRRAAEPRRSRRGALRLDGVLDFRVRLGVDGGDDGAGGERLAIAVAFEGGGGAARLRRAAAALEGVPAVAAASAAGRLRLDVCAADQSWPGGDGTAKRMLTDERPQEKR